MFCSPIESFGAASELAERIINVIKLVDELAIEVHAPKKLNIERCLNVYMIQTKPQIHEYFTLCTCSTTYEYGLSFKYLSQ